MPSSYSSPVHTNSTGCGNCCHFAGSPSCTHRSQLRPRRIPAVAVQMILGQLHHARRVQRHRPQILLEHRRLRRLQRPHLQISEPRPRRREGNRPQKFFEVLQHPLFRKIAQPHTQKRLIGHAPIIPGCPPPPKSLRRMPDFSSHQRRSTTPTLSSRASMLTTPTLSSRAQRGICFLRSRSHARSRSPPQRFRQGTASAVPQNAATASGFSR